MYGMLYIHGRDTYKMDDKYLIIIIFKQRFPCQSFPTAMDRAYDKDGLQGYHINPSSAEAGISQESWDTTRAVDAQAPFVAMPNAAMVLNV